MGIYVHSVQCRKKRGKLKMNDNALKNKAQQQTYIRPYNIVYCFKAKSNVVQTFWLSKKITQNSVELNL